MADPKHIEILYQGVTAWNEWRQTRTYIRPDLRGAYLNGWDLGGINLQDADLRFAFLFRANLEAANLNLASLIGADLIQANLTRADLRQASLSGAYLAGTDLRRANLSGADLRGALMRRAILGKTKMPNGILSDGYCFLKTSEDRKVLTAPICSYPVLAAIAKPQLKWLQTQSS